jgi:hypothetical protein
MGFTEFRTKTEFSDLPIAGNRLKSKVFRPAQRVAAYGTAIA